MTNQPPIALVLALLLSISAHAQTNNTTRKVCGDFEETIDATLKSISLIRAESARSESDSQEQAAQLKILNELTTIDQNLRLMQQNECKAWTLPVRTNAYFVEALKCVNAGKRGDKDMSTCDTRKWVR